MFGPLRRILGFFTVLPVSEAASMEEVAASSYLLPFVAAFLGAFEGAAGWGLSQVFGASVTAAFVLAAALLLTGLHHADGLADLGDALMVHGDAGRRIEVLKDRTMGIGAAGALLLTYLISWAAIAEVIAISPGAVLVVIFITVEVAARLCLLITGILGRPSHQGSGSRFIGTLKGRTGALGVFLSLAIMGSAVLFIPVQALLIAMCATVFTSLALLVVSGRILGGIGGDVLGSSVELGRLAALLGLLAGLYL